MLSPNLKTIADQKSQVIFDAQNAHRRKSSLVPSEAPALTSQRRKNTECFVHSLLESQRRSGNTSQELEGIAETLSQSRLESFEPIGSEAQPPNQQDGSGSSSDSGNAKGQADEEGWKTTIQSGGGDYDSKIEVQQDAVHSRLLTKKQLSDMAWGVRELSKRLGSIRLKLKVKTVFLLTKAHDESLIKNTQEVVRWLLSPDREVRYTVWVEDVLKTNKKFDSGCLIKTLTDEYEQKGEKGEVEKRLRYWRNDMCRTRPHTFDFVVSLGGDGTVLYASWLFQRIVPPVLSFALGSLGFLTKFDYDDFRSALERSFRDGVTISLRLRFEGTVMRSQKLKRSKKKIVDGVEEEGVSSGEEEERDLVEELVGEEKDDERTHRPDGTYEILNDIVVDRGPNPSMSLFFHFIVLISPECKLINLQRCPLLKSSEMTNISLPSKPTASASLLPPAAPPTTSRLAVLSATPKIPLFSLRQYAPIPYPSVQLFFPIRLCLE